MKAFFLFAIPAFLYAGAASAQDWIEIGSNKNQTLEVEPNTIKQVSSSIRSAWFQFKKTNPRSTGYSTSKELDRVDCSGETTAIVSYIGYGADGSVLASKTNPVILLQYEPAAPGTFAATMVSAVCGFNLDKQ